MSDLMHYVEDWRAAADERRALCGVFCSINERQRTWCFVGDIHKVGDQSKVCPECNTAYKLVYERE